MSELNPITELPLPVAAAAVPAPGEPIDQASWNERKRDAVLPNGIRLSYVEIGDPEGAPLLLLHGYTDSSRVWTILAPWLAGHRILIPDQRGHGASDAPESRYAMADFAADARLLLDAMGVGRAAVVGHSMGSIVAQRVGAEHPRRVGRLVLIRSTTRGPVGARDELWTAIMHLREPIADNQEFLRQWGPESSPTPVDPALSAYYEPEIAATPARVWRAVIRELADVPAGQRAADVAAPVLILSGGRDDLFPDEHHRSLISAYPGAEAHVFADLGHNLILERPEVVGPVLAAFLAGTATRNN